MGCADATRLVRCISLIEIAKDNPTFGLVEIGRQPFKPGKKLVEIKWGNQMKIGKRSQAGLLLGLILPLSVALPQQSFAQDDELSLIHI